MPCTLCPHPTCRHSVVRKGVTACPECENGTVVLDPVSAPAWRLDCNSCTFLIYLPKDLHNAALSKELCEVGDLLIIHISRLCVWLWHSTCQMSSPDDMEPCTLTGGFPLTAVNAANITITVHWGVSLGTV